MVNSHFLYGVDMQNTKTFSLEIEKMTRKVHNTHGRSFRILQEKRIRTRVGHQTHIQKSKKDKIDSNARDLNYLPNQIQSYRYERVGTHLSRTYKTDTLLGLVWTIFSHRLHHFIKGEGFTD